MDDIIIYISDCENVSFINLKKYIKSFEKKIKYEISNYYDIEGLEDYRMNPIDYEILLELYKQTKSDENKIKHLLIFMYCFYKLEGISLPIKFIRLNSFLNFINLNDNLHMLIFEIVTKKYETKKYEIL